MHPFRRLLPIAILLASIIAVGVLGYIEIEGWNLLDASYMVVITLFSIGFEEVHELSTAGRVFTMVIIVTGVGSGFYAASRVLEIIVEGEMSGYQKRKRMDKKIGGLRDHYIVCGFGRVGHQVAQSFAFSKVPYVVIDNKPGTLEELEQQGAPAIIGDATEDAALINAGIQRAKGLVACSDSDVANVYVTLSARALNPRLHIVARAGIKDTEKKLLMAGADRVISPYFISGLRMAALALRPVTSDFLDLVTHGGQVDFKLYEITLPEHSSLSGMTLEEADVRDRSGAMVLAIRKKDGSFVLQPSAASVLDRGDVLVVIGTQEQFERLEKMVVLDKPFHKSHRA